jgi:hypothetical protein
METSRCLLDEPSIILRKANQVEVTVFSFVVAISVSPLLIIFASLIFIYKYIVLRIKIWLRSAHTINEKHFLSRTITIYNNNICIFPLQLQSIYY